MKNLPTANESNPRGVRRVLVLVGCVLVAMVGGYLLWDQEGGQGVGEDARGREHGSAPTKTIREWLATKVGRRVESGENRELSQYVRRQFEDAPFTASGVNVYAKDYYGLDQEQVEAIEAVAVRVREKIADTIVDGLEELEDPKDSMRAFVHRGSVEYADAIREELCASLSAIVDEGFGQAAVSALVTDDRYFSGGERDTFIYINPNVEEPTDQVISVRYEVRLKDGSRAQNWEGSPQELKRMLLIDLEHALEQETEGQSRKEEES